MLSPHILSALAAEREADLERRAELARRRHVEPAAQTPQMSQMPGTRVTRLPTRRRRHLRLV